MFVRPIQPAVSSRLGRWRGGAAAVEFAFVCIPLFMLIVAALELGRAMMVLEYMSNAARVACRYAVVQPPPTDGTNLTNIQAKATNTLAIAMVKTTAPTVNVYFFTPSSPSFTPPTDTSTWTTYPNTTSTHPASQFKDYVRVNVQVNASDVTWVPFYWFLGKNQQFSVNEDMTMEF